MPSRVLLQDFTGVPARGRPGGDARRDGSAWAATRRKINPLQPVELVIDHSVQVDEFGTPHAFAAQRRARVRAQPRALRLPALGPERRSRTSQVVPPDTGIVHQVNLEYLARVVVHRRRRTGVPRLSRHAGRHRLAHHDDQRPGRARLGRRRHRGRGGHARPAGLDAHPAGRRLPAARRAARGRDRDRPRADRHRRCCARRAWSASSSSSSAPGLAALPLADRATIANMAPEYGATCGIFPVDAETLATCASPGRSERADRAGRGLLQGAGAVPHAGHARSRTTPTRWSSTSAPSSRAWPGRSGRRTACALTRREASRSTSRRCRR